jgi:hypothetical protein
MIGYFYPPTTGNYTFYLSSDDQSELFLSTDSSPDNKRMIAAETAWSQARQYTSSAGGSDLRAKRSDQYTGTKWPTGNTITLTQGKAYYIEALMKQGSGGDNLSVSIDGVSPIPLDLLSSFQGGAESQPQSIANINNTDPWSVTVVNGVTNIVAGGLDVWDLNWNSASSCGSPIDQFVFDYLPITGDFDYRLRVVSMTVPSAWSKSGLMARANLTPGSANVFCAATPPPPGNGFYCAQGRDSFGGCSWYDPNAEPTATYPNAWLRLRREGPVFKYYYSSDGYTWHQFSVHDTSNNGLNSGLPAFLLLGIATTAHNVDAPVAGATVTAQVSDFGEFFTIVQQPLPQQVVAGDTAAFSVTVANVRPADVEYQWLLNGVPIAGATRNPLVILNASANNQGLYSVRITYTPCGDELTSKVAPLRVVPTSGSPQAGVLAQLFENDGPGYTLASLLTNPRFPNQPDIVFSEPYFELWATGDISTVPVIGTGYHSYGARLTGYFHPPTTENYTFYICSDDTSELFLSTDANPGNKRLIAAETSWSNLRQYTSSPSSDPRQKRSDQYTATQWPTGNTISLTQGKAYYIEAIGKENWAGGDNLSVSINGQLPIDGSYLSPVAGNPTSAAPIVQTLPATPVSTTSARLNAFVYPNGASTTAYCEYGTTLVYGNTTVSDNVGTVAQNVSFDVTGLAAGTRYHYRIVASNSQGMSNGDDATFITGGAPTILIQPVTQHALAGASVTFSVGADGQLPLSYQWRFNGANIPGATSATLTLNSVGAGNDGAYSVVVWNAINSVVSAPASLAVLTDGANGTQPAQVSVPASPTKPTGVDSLVIVTHGWELEGPFANISWITGMADAIRTRVDPAKWVVMPFDWAIAAWSLDPDVALFRGVAVGGLYAKLRLQSQHWEHIHFIGHSAGSAVIEAMAQQLKSGANPPEIHETFLDPYTEFITLAGQQVYGANADWSDCYFVNDWTGASTGGGLADAFNVDISWVDPDHTQTPIPCPSSTAGSTPPLLDNICGYQAWSSHGYLVDFYSNSVANALPTCAAGYGFPLSKEGGGWANRGNYPPNSANPLVLCGLPSIPQNLFPVNVGQPFQFSLMPSSTSSFGVSFTGIGGATFSAVSSQFPPPGPRPLDVSTNAPAWLALGVRVTNTINFVRFDSGFTDTNGSQGLMTVYWNTNQIGLIDERVATSGMQTYRFPLPAPPVSSGLYTLSFRLDVFTNTESSVTVTNVATGFVGITQPISLNMLLMGSNNTPVLKLAAAPGYNYLVQSSTNLVDWSPTALLVNTNGAVLFADPAVTNRGARFYRAMMP